MCVTTVDNVSVFAACLSPLCEMGSLASWCFCFDFLCVRAYVCVLRAVMLAHVVRLHDFRYSYDLALCADAWPYEKSVCVCVLRLAALTEGVAQRTRCTFTVVNIYYRVLFFSF